MSSKILVSLVMISLDLLCSLNTGQTRYVKELSMIYDNEMGISYYCTFGTKKIVEAQHHVSIQEYCFENFQEMVHYLPDGTSTYPFLFDGTPGGFVLNCSLNINNGNLSKSCNGLIHSTCGVKCDPGYFPAVDSVTCNLAQPYNNVTAVWSHSQPCQPLSCPSNFSHGKLKEPCDPVTHATCGITCDPGFSPLVDNVTCNPAKFPNATVEWTHHNPCSPSGQSEGKSFILIIGFVVSGTFILVVVACCCKIGMFRKSRNLSSCSTSKNSLSDDEEKEDQERNPQDPNPKDNLRPATPQPEVPIQNSPQPSSKEPQTSAPSQRTPDSHDPCQSDARAAHNCEPDDCPSKRPSNGSLGAESLDSNPSEITPSSPNLPQGLTDRHIEDFPSIPPEGTVGLLQDSFPNGAFNSNRFPSGPISSKDENLQFSKDPLLQSLEVESASCLGTEGKKCDVSPLPRKKSYEDSQSSKEEKSRLLEDESLDSLEPESAKCVFLVGSNHCSISSLPPQKSYEGVSVGFLQDSIHSAACNLSRLRAEPPLSSEIKSLQHMKAADLSERCQANVNCLWKCEKSLWDSLLVKMEPSRERTSNETIDGYVTQSLEEMKRLRFDNCSDYQLVMSKFNQPHQFFAKEILERMAAQGDTVPDLLDYFEHRNSDVVKLILNIHKCDKCRKRYSFKCKDIPL